MTLNGISGTNVNNDTKLEKQSSPKDKKTVNVPVGQKQTVEKTEDPKTGTYAASKINDVETRIAEKKLSLVNAKPDEREKIEKEIKDLQQKKKLQDEAAILKESESGNVEFKMKKDMNVEEFKKLFDIKDGVLANNPDLKLEPEWKYPPKGSPDEDRQYKDYSNCVIDKGKVFEIAPSSINNQGIFTEFINWISH